MRGVAFAMLRHAPTPWNEQGLLQGSTDIDLSPDGEAMARGWKVPAPYDRWRRVASPLTRARRTAELLEPPAAITLEPRLSEIDYGAWEGRALADLERERRAAEAPPDIRLRVAAWVIDVARAGLPTLAVAHKGVIKTLRTLSGRKTGELKTGCLQVFTAYRNGRVTFDRINLPL